MGLRDGAEEHASAEIVVRLQQASFEAHLLQRFQNRYWPITSKIGRARMIRGAGWSMLRGARGRAAIARGARIAAFAVSAATALWVASLAAEGRKSVVEGDGAV